MARVLLPLAEGCEELEAVTVIDLLRRAGIDVVVAGLAEGAVKASRGVVLTPDVALDAVLDQDFDMIVLPGGAGGAARLEADARVHRLLQRQADAGRYVAAICAAPKVLLAAGLL
ncbi:MAG TPA: DJ-1/PfpI family protein, partial [Nitrococcus sp.]|nr:DJ-1/PfpI family protein [Nitrococcus sp.]